MIESQIFKENLLVSTNYVFIQNNSNSVKKLLKWYISYYFMKYICHPRACLFRKLPARTITWANNAARAIVIQAI